MANSLPDGRRFIDDGVTALRGVRVLDLSTFTPGPFGTQILADLGATVLKIERPGSGDPERDTVPEYFHAYNRGKFSLELDLKNVEDRQVCLDLGAEADIVVEGFRPGVVDRLGVGYAHMVEVNPDVIYASLSGYGQSGPLRDEAGHDPEYMALTGGLALNEVDADGVPIYHSAFHVGDYASGMYAIIAALAALARPELRPVYVDVPVAAASLAWAFPRLHHHRVSGTRVEVGGEGIFRTADDRFVTITPSDMNNWRNLCAAIDRKAWVTDPAMQSRDGRMGRASAINSTIRDFMRSRTLDECMAILKAHDVSAAPVRAVDEVFDDPDIGHWDLLRSQPVDHVEVPIFGLSRRRNILSPRLGQDNELVRRDGWSGLESLSG